MTITVDSLLENALCLSDESRLRLAERLVESVEPDPSLFAAQVAEAQRRDQEMDAEGDADIPGEEVLRKVRQDVREIAAR